MHRPVDRTFLAPSRSVPDNNCGEKQQNSSGPLVSIVVNNFNYAPFVASAVDSALSQTYTNTEVIVVDDGSTDASREILGRYSHRVKLILQTNKGQAQAANSGFAASNGDIVFFLDADDTLAPHAAETVVQLWGPGLCKVQFPLQAIDETGTPLHIRIPRRPLDDANVRGLLLNQGEYATPPTSGNAFGRDSLLRVLPVPAEWPSKKALDKYLLHSTPFFGEVRSCQHTLGYYRIHGQNRSQMTNSDKRNVAVIAAFVNEQMAVRELIARTAESLGCTISPNCITGSYTFRKNTLALKKLGGNLGPQLSENTSKLVWRLVTAAWRHPTLDPLTACALTCWGVLLGTLPRPLAKPLIRFGMSPASRPTWLRKIVLPATKATRMFDRTGNQVRGAAAPTSA
jgi:glycosyltransferase involved in cell wall biosynthesis